MKGGCGSAAQEITPRSLDPLMQQILTHPSILNHLLTTWNRWGKRLMDGWQIVLISPRGLRSINTPTTCTSSYRQSKHNKQRYKNNTPRYIPIHHRIVNRDNILLMNTAPSQPFDLELPSSMERRRSSTQTIGSRSSRYMEINPFELCFESYLGQKSDQPKPRSRPFSFDSKAWSASISRHSSIRSTDTEPVSPLTQPKRRQWHSDRQWYEFHDSSVTTLRIHPLPYIISALYSPPHIMTYQAFRCGCSVIRTRRNTTHSSCAIK